MILYRKIRNQIRDLRGKYNSWRDQPLVDSLCKVGAFDSSELIRMGQRIRNVRGQHYGIKNILINKCDALNGLKLSVEHGVYFFADVLDIDIKRVLRESPSCLVTFGEFRATRVRQWARCHKQNFLCATMGPYIVYADPFYTNCEATILKKELGRMLLVFPSHGWEGASAKFDQEAFVAEIKKVASLYQSVCISMYWHDFLEGKHHRYEEEGWKIVCAGHRADPYFLPRLRSLIELADMTMSNSLGTHVGYCVSLEKRHYIFKQSNCCVEDRPDSVEHEFEPKEIIDAFSLRTDEITEKQRELVEFYWGKAGEVEFFESAL